MGRAQRALVDAGHGLQEFLAQLESTRPELVRRESREIDPGRHETAAYLQTLEDGGDWPVVVFENPLTFGAEKSAFPLVHNLFATRGLCAAGIGEPLTSDRMALSVRFGELQQSPVPHQVIGRDQAPVLGNVRSGEDADVRMLPAGRYHEKDAGLYFVMACLMKARSGPFYDVTLCKNMVHGPRTLSVSTHGHHHLTRIIAEYEREGLPTPIAVVLGHHPGFFLGACALTPYGNQDYDTIGAYLGAPLRVAPSATLGDDFLIPADAEIVIEGLVQPGARVSQNPFGEITGHYQEKMNAPAMEVTGICFRGGAVMAATFPAHADHINLGSVPKEGSVHAAIGRVVPEVTAIHLPHSGRGRFSAYISMRKRDFRDVQVAAMVALAEMPNLKLVIVVDDDVDVFSEQQVLWAATTQTRWDQDVAVIPRVQSFRSWLGDAVCIVDATRPSDVPDFPEQSHVPPDAFDRLKRRAVI